LIRIPPSLSIGAVLLLATVSASCFNPVHSDDVAALGGEVAGVREGPTHRPGQPCLVCHGGKGPGSPEFEIAGTIYELRDSPSAPAEGVEIVITDSSTPPKSITLQSNRAGNFYLEKDRESFFYPLYVELDDARIKQELPLVPTAGIRNMRTAIGRNAGCAFCHVNGVNDADKKTHMPQVFLNTR
jgi:hypothetical protein